jgi:hypothetical protein
VFDTMKWPLELYGAPAGVNSQSVERR